MAKDEREELLEGYPLSERLRGIALIQDPTRADILRLAADKLFRLECRQAFWRGFWRGVTLRSLWEWLFYGTSKVSPKQLIRRMTRGEQYEPREK